MARTDGRDWLAPAVIVALVVGAATVVVTMWAGHVGPFAESAPNTTTTTTTTLPELLPGAAGFTERRGEFNAALQAADVGIFHPQLLDRAFAAGVTLCRGLPTPSDPPDDPVAAMAEGALTERVTSEAFEEFESSNFQPNVRLVVLNVTGETLCPEHRDQIDQYLSDEGP